MDLVATVLDGILLGGLYALFAAGLSLIFGVISAPTGFFRKTSLKKP